MKHREVLPNSEPLQDISDTKTFVVTGEKYLKTNFDALLRTTASLLISARKTNGSAIS